MRLSRLLPYRAFVIETSLTPEQTKTHLRSLTDDPFGFLSGDGPQDEHCFRGVVRDSSFQLLRKLNGGANPRAIIEGHIEETRWGSRVEIELRLAIPALLLTSFVGIGAMAGEAAAVMSVLSGGSAAALLIPLLPLIVVALIWGSFAYDATRDEKFLRRVFPPASGGTTDEPYRGSRDAAAG